MNKAKIRIWGPWAVITGASSGIGHAFAWHLAELGLNLVLLGRRREALEGLALRLQQEHGIKTRVVASDLSSPQGNLPLFEATQDLDVGLLVAAAGYGSSGRFLTQGLVEEMEMVDVNCKAVLEQAWYYGHCFKARGGGAMILFGSVLGFQGVPLSANYAATKAYVQSLAEALRWEWRLFGIDVLACAPGPVRTGFSKRANMRMQVAIEPDVVAREGLMALGIQATVRPGWVSKVLGWSLAMAPRSLRVYIMGGVMRSMALAVAPHAAVKATRFSNPSDKMDRGQS